MPPTLRTGFLCYEERKVVKWKGSSQPSRTRYESQRGSCEKCCRWWSISHALPTSFTTQALLQACTAEPMSTSSKEQQVELVFCSSFGLFLTDVQSCGSGSCTLFVTSPFGDQSNSGLAFALRRSPTYLMPTFFTASRRAIKNGHTTCMLNTIIQSLAQRTPPQSEVGRMCLLLSWHLDTFHGQTQRPITVFHHAMLVQQLDRGQGHVTVDLTEMPQQPPPCSCCCPS